MKKFFITIIVILLTFHVLYGQEMDETEKMKLYESTKKSQTTAVLLSFLLTSTGHAYAGNWGRGLAFTAGRVGCAVLAFTVGIKETTETESGYYFTMVTIKEEKTPLYYIGIGGAIAFAIWEMVDASNQVKKYNQKTHDRIFGTSSKIGLDLVPQKYGASIKLSYNF